MRIYKFYIFSAILAQKRPRSTRLRGLRLMQNEVDAQPFWIGSFPDRVTHDGTKHSWSSLIKTPFLQSEFDACGAEFDVASYPGSVIWGVAWVSVDRRHSPNDKVAKYESSQLKAWCTFFKTTETRDLSQILVFFRLGNMWLLNDLAPIPTYVREGRKKGALVELEGDYHLRLFNKLKGHPNCPPPRMVLRVPALWAPLLMSKHWQTVSIPDLSYNNFALNIQWDQMLLSKPEERKILYDAEPELTQALWDECADFLRSVHDSHDAIGAEDEQLYNLERLIQGCQSMSDNLDLDTLKTVYLSAGFTSQRHKKFDKAYLLKILMMCSALKTSYALGDVFKDMVEACLPNGLKYMVKEVVASAARQMPSQATVSRYRMMLDGAFMLWERQQHAALVSQGGATRFIMADSSMQHGSEFEGVVCLTIANQDLLPAYNIANKLVRTRSSSVIVANC